MRRRWPTLAGLGFAALIAFDLMSGVELAPVLAASAAVYLGAAALQRPVAAWPLFFATGVVITMARLLEDRFEPTWAILAGAVGLLIYGLLRGAGRPGRPRSGSGGNSSTRHAHGVVTVIGAPGGKEMIDSSAPTGTPYHAGRPPS